MSGAAKLALGPVLYNWPAERLRDFYCRVADEAAIDIVYLGEVVCAKRAPFFAPHLDAVAARLARAGKEVALSTLALVMTEAELDGVRALADRDDYPIEANDISAAAMLAGRPHVIGPFINVYNEATLAYLAANGATRVALPCELAEPAIAALAHAGTAEIEVQAFGRLPLAISARCHHARSHGLHKDGCRYVCAEDADGLAVETLEGAGFLAINGTQTQSHACCNLIGEVMALAEAGVGCFRLWPQDIDMIAVAAVFRAVLDRRLDAEDGRARLAALAPDLPFANGYVHGRVGAALVAE